jgi:DnaA family protein
MQQLPLDIRLADYALFKTFYDGPNGEPVHALRNILESGHFAVLWLWGATDTGKTHLLQAAVNAADGNEFRSAYLPLGAGFDLSPEVLEGLGDFDVICVDDVDAVAGDKAWEQALFRLFESLRQGQGRLVIAASESPLHGGFVLPDLVSRFSSGATFRLTQLSDEDKLSAMQLRANWRGLELSDDTARYLISRVGRGCSQLFTLLDQLDREALTAQKKLTIPFVKAVLNKESKA